MMQISRSSIGAKLLGAFLAMAAVIALLGVYSFLLLARSSAMVIDTFDRPLMAVSYARAANLDFSQIEQRVLQRATAKRNERATIDQEIVALTSSFSSDLAVAEERSTEIDERREIDWIKAHMEGWVAARHSGDSRKMYSLAHQIDEAFDLLVEYYTDHTFTYRQAAVDSIAQFRIVIGSGVVGSLLLALFATLFLTRKIAHPLAQAASAADRVAAGEFETQIPVGGSDEIGTLLRSMTSMQNNIRSMVDQEKTRAASAEGRLADALETSDEGVMLVGPDDRLITVNSQLRAYFPDALDSLVPGAPYRVLVAELGSMFEDRFEQETSGGTRISTEEHRLPDGRWVRISISPTSDRGKIVFVSDFTKIKEREENYKQAKHEAEAASAAKSRFLANMSHELRTPLNAIIGFSEIISGQLFGSAGNPRYVEYARDILGSGRHLLDVINSVLDLSKTEAGKMDLRLEQIDLREVLHDCAKMVADQCRDAGLRLNVSGLHDRIPVEGETAKLRQIFLNLLSNAIKFTEPGGEINVEAVQDDAQVRVCVSDTGIGMSPTDIEVALTPFGQVDNRLERKYEGTGLGLPLTKSLVELHGGSLHIESTLGLGTSVSVRLRRTTMGAKLGSLALAGY